MKIPKSFTLSKETIDKLNKFSKDEYSSNSTSVERILNKYIDEHNKKKEMKRIEEERIERENKEFLKNLKPDHNRVTPPNFDKVDINAGRPKASYGKF